MSGVNVLFAHDTEVALQSAAALVNTGSGGAETLVTTHDLDRFVEEQQWTGSRTHDEEELDQVRSLRPRLRAIWTSGVDEAVERVNSLLAEFQALPQLVRHDAWDYHLHATPAGAPLASRMAVEAAMAFVDVIRAGELERLRLCAAADCEDVVVDLSKNRSRRYCDGGCANRAHVTAYRLRRAGGDARRGR